MYFDPKLFGNNEELYTQGKEAMKPLVEAAHSSFVAMTNYADLNARFDRNNDGFKQCAYWKGAFIRYVHMLLSLTWSQILIRSEMSPKLIKYLSTAFDDWCFGENTSSTIEIMQLGLISIFVFMRCL
jgi:hypothetical protein